MTALDIFVIILLGGGALLGFVRGFVHEVLTLFAWVAAILAVLLVLLGVPLRYEVRESEFVIRSGLLRLRIRFSRTRSKTTTLSLTE